MFAMDTLKTVWRQNFLPDFERRIWPMICNAYLKDDIAYLSNVCADEALALCRAEIDQRKQAKRQAPGKVLWYDPIELLDAKLTKEGRPQLVLKANVHTLDCLDGAVTNEEEITPLSPPHIQPTAKTAFLLILEPNIEEKFLQYSGYPWQVRSLHTTNQRQLF
ncbi:hypothetical protein RFI_21720 [Reticulomyxa filosa]|uniref:Tim44-like domain-containing protein n=1 Tax=Reticulomyxa filosa TaxID=46433 RepID=X6MRB1_RETFI|nr:hypothetical protein RFI_21720 [Reticulomyxa filosa]|eukprot:ETO15645.1 hypothetical protein RFI_21720 [Reticulomyxa filosa]